MSYYLALREDFFREKIAEQRAIAKAKGGDENVIEVDAEAAKSGHLASKVNESLDRQAGG